MAIAPDPEFPDKGRLIGIDYGTKRVGIAVSTGDRTISSPVEVYQRRNALLDAKYFRELKQEYRPVGLVVGLPIHIGGEEGATARHAREYGAWLSETMKVPVTFWDERYTSVVADEYMLAVDMSRKKRKARVDMLAAHVMLQSYLDHQAALAREAASLLEDELPEEES
ncbi:MAG: Holliday junction resolvase RuvX [Planctomycetaceae bacterium]